MREQDRKHGKHLGQRRVLIVERHIVMQHGGQASRHVHRLVERRGVGPRLGQAEREEAGGHDSEHDQRKPGHPEGAVPALDQDPVRAGEVSAGVRTGRWMAA